MDIIIYILIGLLSVMIGIYLTMCFICWIIEVLDEESWKYWFK